jgi:hypothetical protein
MSLGHLGINLFLHHLNQFFIFIQILVKPVKRNKAFQLKLDEKSSG